MAYKRYKRYKDSGVEWIGKIPEHWEVCKLKYILRELVSGGTPTSTDEENWTEDEDGINWVSISDMSNTDNVYETAKRITLKGLREKNLRILRSGTLVYSIYATLGKVAELKIDAVTNQAILGLILNEERANKRFIKRYLESLERYILYLSSSNTQNNLNAEKVRSIYLVLPQKDEQVAIADFLDQKTAEIDSLIADKEKLIRLLQEQRQAIISEAVTKGLDPNVPMKDSGVEWIGEIPAHWKVKRIKYIALVNPKKSEIKYLSPDIEVTFIPMENITATGIVDYTLTNTVENLINSYTYFRDGDIIMAKVTPCFENGNIAIVDGLSNGIGFGTTELHVLRCNNENYSRFLFYYLQSNTFKLKGISEMYGVAGLKRIPTDFVLNYKLGLPNYEEQKAIAGYLDQKTTEIDSLIADIQTQMAKLKEYRESLISEAVTGKIDA